VASYEHDDKTFGLELPRWLANGLLERKYELESWGGAKHGAASGFDLARDFWINLWRWSPQPSALAALREYAEQVRLGKRIKTTSREFKMMLRHLPRGTHLPTWARRDVH
jgi:hypothetical protein